MAVSEKVTYATRYTTHNGRLFKPGEQLSGRMSPEVLAHAVAGGLTTNSHAEAEAAQAAEMDRRQRVSTEIETRSDREPDQGKTPVV